MTVLLNWLGILLVTNENPLVSFISKDVNKQANGSADFGNNF